MKNKLFVAFAMVCVLAGCRDPGADTSTAQGNVPGADTGAMTPDVVAPAAKRLDTPLPGGISNPSFDYHLNADRAVANKKDGSESREIGMELLGNTPVQAESTFSQSVTQAGGSVTQRQERNGALRVVYGLADGTSMLAWFRSGPPTGDKYALQRADATGTVYLAWPYSEKSAQ